MSKFAAKTEVPVEKSKAEIEAIVRRYGADSFISGWNADSATVQFRCQDRIVRFLVKLPLSSDEAFTVYALRGGVKRQREAGGAARLWEQACRQKWRALALLVKAKLEAVDAGLSTFEHEFFADIVMPDGKTVYETAKGAVAVCYAKGVSQPLLTGY